jgi:hypothetical protein
MSTLKWILFTAIGLYLVSLIGLYFLQRQLLYFPRHAVNYEVEHNYELQVNDVTLRGWMVNEGRPAAMIFYGGNAERIDFYIKNFQILFSGHTIYFVNYRGYGESDGRPSQQALYSDALAVYDAIKTKYERIDLLGKSLGSGVAVYVAANRPVHRMALVTPYDSILNVAKTHYSMIPVGLILKDKYESWKYAEKISAQTLLVSAENDQTIPAASTANLAAHIRPDLLTVKQIKGADHNSISAEESYYEALVDFFGRP